MSFLTSMSSKETWFGAEVLRGERGAVGGGGTLGPRNDLCYYWGGTRYSSSKCQEIARILPQVSYLS